MQRTRCRGIRVHINNILNPRPFYVGTVKSFYAMNFAYTSQWTKHTYMSLLLPILSYYLFVESYKYEYGNSILINGRKSHLFLYF